MAKINRNVTAASPVWRFVAPAIVCLAFLGVSPEAMAQSAQDAANSSTVDQRIDSLQKQLDELRAERPHTDPPPPNQVAASPYGQGGGAKLVESSNVNLTLNGFIDASLIERSRFEGSDIASSFNLGPGGIPLKNSPNYHLTEFRGSARLSRLSLLAQGQGDYQTLSAYYESDFLGSGTNSNSRETNSYVPRLRQAFASWDAGSWHILGGQAWSILTLNKMGIIARQEQLPPTIEANYVVGFTWDRNPQFRVVKDFNKTLWMGLAIESPQANITAGGLPSSSNTACSSSLFASDCVYYQSTTNSSLLPATLSLDQAPDLIGKVAADTAFGHYEAYGVGRFFTDRTTIGGHQTNNTTFGGGGGLAALIPIVPKVVDIQASVTGGLGIGRYGTAQFNDAVINPHTGTISPIPQIIALLGVDSHPFKRTEFYVYGGYEKQWKTDATSNRGLGFPLTAAQLSACATEGGTCVAQAEAVWQATAGIWYDAYKGSAGTFRIGVQDSYTKLYTFSHGPSTDDNMLFLSLRYSPF